MTLSKKKPVKKTEEKPEKPPRGYEYRTFLVKKEPKKSDRANKVATRRTSD